MLAFQIISNYWNHWVPSMFLLVLIIQNKGSVYIGKNQYTTLSLVYSWSLPSTTYSCICLQPMKMWFLISGFYQLTTNAWTMHVSKDRDFVEVFSGRGEVSRGFRDVTWPQIQGLTWSGFEHGTHDVFIDCPIFVYTLHFPHGTSIDLELDHRCFDLTQPAAFSFLIWKYLRNMTLVEKARYPHIGTMKYIQSMVVDGVTKCYKYLFIYVYTHSSTGW